MARRLRVWQGVNRWLRNRPRKSDKHRSQSPASCDQRWSGLETLETRTFLSADPLASMLSDDSSMQDDVVQIMTTAPELDLLGKDNIAIGDGDNAPAALDGSDFGNHLVGSTVSQIFTIRNNGTGVLNLSGAVRVAISGAHAADFTVTTQPAATVEPGQSTTFTIEFKPGAIGTRTATVSIDSDDANEDPYNFTITGRGVSEQEIDIRGNNNTPIPDGDIDPTAAKGTDFGDVIRTATGVTRTFTIRNTGGLPLNLLGVVRVQITGAAAGDFTVTLQPPATINAGGVGNFTIRFSPTAVGERTATVTIASDDSNEGTYTFEITGNGVDQPDINVSGAGSNNIPDGSTTPSPASGTDFGNLIVDSDTGTVTRTFRIINTGNLPLVLNNLAPVTISGADSEDFTLTTPPPVTTLQPNEFTEFQITFNPSRTDLRTATVTIQSNDPNEAAYEFTIAGYGILSTTTADNELVIDTINEGRGNRVAGTGSYVRIRYVGRLASTGAVFDEGMFDFTVDSGGVIAGFNQGVKDMGTREKAVLYIPAELGYGNNPPSNSGIPAGADLIFEVEVVSIRGNVKAQLVSQTNRRINSGDDTPDEREGTVFPDTAIGVPVTMSFLLDNRGPRGSRLIMDGTPKVTFSGPNASEFTLKGSPTSNNVFTIEFKPTGAGVRTAIVSIPSNDPDQDPYTFTVQGEALATSISVSNASATETDDGTVTMLFQVTLSQAVNDAPVTVEYETNDVTARRGSDYEPVKGTLTFAPGETTKNVTVEVPGDTEIEVTETFTLNLSNPSANAAIVDGEGVGTITTDDAPIVRIVALDSDASEDRPTSRGAAKFRIYREGPRDQPLTVSYTISGTAVNGTDYRFMRGAAVPTSVTLAANSPYYDIIINPVEDTLAESGETFIITLNDATTYDLTADTAERSATATIADNAPVLSIEARDDQAGEDRPTTRAGMGIFRIERDGDRSRPVTVTYTVSGTATNGGANTDYTTLSGSIVIPARKRFVDLLVIPADDLLQEGLETVIVTLSTGSTYHLTPVTEQRSATLEIGDNDE